YGGVPNYFDREELDLLGSLAENLSFALASYRREAALRASESTMAIAQSISHFGSWESDLTIADDRNPDALRWSDEMYRIAGLSPGEAAITREQFIQM